MDASIFPLASSARQLNRLSRDFRNQRNKQLHSRNSSPAVLISPDPLRGISPKHLCRAWLIVLPHLNNGDTGNVLNRSLRSVKRIWGPLLLFLRKLRGRSSDARGLRPMRTPTPPPRIGAVNTSFYGILYYINASSFIHPSPFGVSSGDRSVNPATSCAWGHSGLWQGF